MSKPEQVLLAAVWVLLGSLIMGLILDSEFRRTAWRAMFAFARVLTPAFAELGKSFAGIFKGVENMGRMAGFPRRSRWPIAQRGIIVMPRANPPSLDQLVGAAKKVFLDSWPPGKPLDFEALDTLEKTVFELYKLDWDDELDYIFTGIEKMPQGPPGACACNQPGDYCHCGGQSPFPRGGIDVSMR